MVPMLARRTPGRLTRSDAAEVGVGTLIVFIAMVLVAAVAAAVIISTSGTLQERALATGKEATEEVTANLRVHNVYGIRPSTADDVETVAMYIELASGSQPMPLEALIIRYSDGTNEDYYRLGTAPAFTLNWIRGTNSNDVLKAGDLVELSFVVDSGPLPPRSSFELSLMPERGAPVSINGVTPSTYGDDLQILIR